MPTLATGPARLTLVLLSRSGVIFFAKYTNLREQPEKLANSLNALFEGCSLLFQIVDQRHDTGQVFPHFDTLCIQVHKCSISMFSAAVQGTNATWLAAPSAGSLIILNT